MAYTHFTVLMSTAKPLILLISIFVYPAPWITDHGVFAGSKAHVQGLFRFVQKIIQLCQGFDSSFGEGEMVTADLRFERVNPDDCR